MLILKMVVTLQLLWFAAGVVDTIFNSRMREGFLTAVTASFAALLAHYLWQA